mmetsp:Transcript_12327/g.25986  ORF Transcript_12327/g.25986 Transcript_12327/m.25986 type:complete len:376 (-) Transcript_12327:186-1313(-)
MSEDSSAITDFAVATTLFTIVAATTVLGVRRRKQELKEARVAEINVYPIKSCGPMTVKTAKVTDIGFSYDRFAQVSDSEGNYLTPRDKANVKLFHVKPSIVYEGSSIHLDLIFSNGSSEASSFRIKNLNDTIVKSVTKEVTPMIGPAVRLQDLGDDVASWLSEATLIKDCRLTAIGPKYHRLVEMNPDQGEPVPFLDDSGSDKKKDVSETIPTDDQQKLDRNIPTVSLADEAPFLLTTTSSFDDLNSRLKARGKSEVEMQRFRPNIVVKGTLPWEEDTWKRIRIGGVVFHVWQRCGRCAMTTIDRKTLERGPEPLATLSTFRERKGQRNFGVHMIPVSNISIESNELSLLLEMGQKIEVLEYNEERLEEWRRLFT